MSTYDSIDNTASTGQDGAEGNYTYKYPHPSVTADCCIFAFVENELAVLLIRRGIEPFKGQWALPGGFMRIDESLEECALRELREETGFTATRLTQVGAYSKVYRDPRERVVTVAFYTLARWAYVQGGDDAVEARWFNVNKLPDLAFDHKEIVLDSLARMRRDVYFEPIGFELLPPTFSMPELQKLIESITGNRYDRRNFYNKMRHSGFFTESSALPSMMPTHDDSRLSIKPIAVDYSEFDDDFEISGRRRRVRYSFNPKAFEKKRNDKGSTPITY